jgi:hypothetical protein
MYDIWVDCPVATAASANRQATYWNTLENVQPACKAALESGSRMIKTSWSGTCKNGLAEGCGSLTNGAWRETGCFLQGLQQGRWVWETSDVIVVSVFDKDRKTQISFSNKPGQEERDRIRQAAFVEESAARQRRDSEELRNALGQLSAATGSAGAQRTAVPAGQSVVTSTGQPTSQPTQQTSSSTTATGPNGESAMNCISITRPSADGWAQMHNACPYIVSVSWCYTGTSDCKHATWGYTNTGNVAAGGVRLASTFVSRAGQYGLAFAACKGRDVLIQEADQKTSYCK